MEIDIEILMTIGAFLGALLQRLLAVVGHGEKTRIFWSGSEMEQWPEAIPDITWIDLMKNSGNFKKISASN